MAETISDKKILTTRELVYVIGVVTGWLFQFYSLKMEIREAVLNSKSDNQLINLRLDRLEDQDKVHDLTIKTMADVIGDMVKVEQPEIKRRRK